MTDEQLADLVDDAADLIETDGWIQDAEHTDLGYCMIGALRRASGFHIHMDGFSHFSSACEAIMNRMRINDIATWNDHDGRTKQEVLDNMRLVAKELRK